MLPPETTVEKVILAEPRGFCAEVIAPLKRCGAPSTNTAVRSTYVIKSCITALYSKLLSARARFSSKIWTRCLRDSASSSAPTASHPANGSARDRNLRVIDATCPLVTKVHSEVERYAADGRTVILIGHAGHEEVRGTLGVAPGRILLVGTSEEAERLDVPDPERVAAVSQTTLSVDDTRDIMETLRRRFSSIATPKTDDIATRPKTVRTP